jgi:hypothetical protein
VQRGDFYVQGPHRQLTSGTQDSFFHQWLFSAVLKLNSSRVNVVGLNAPGSIGLGVQTRQPPSSPLSLVERISEAICSIVNDLKQEGTDRVGIMCGSLAALPVLRCLPRLEVQTACCFVSAIFDPAAAIDCHWLPLVGRRSDEKLLFQTKAERTSLMFIHGEEDEFAPATECVRFICSLLDEVDTQLVLLPGEGHIFRNPASWRDVANEACSFFHRRLMDDSDA